MQIKTKLLLLVATYSGTKSCRSLRRRGLKSTCPRDYSSSSFFYWRVALLALSTPAPALLTATSAHPNREDDDESAVNHCCRRHCVCAPSLVKTLSSSLYFLLRCDRNLFVYPNFRYSSLRLAGIFLSSARVGHSKLIILSHFWSFRKLKLAFHWNYFSLKTRLLKSTLAVFQKSYNEAKEDTSLPLPKV